MFCPVVDGPFVLTDARQLDRSATTWLYTVALPNTCTIATSCTTSGVGSPAGTDLDVLVGLSLVVPATGTFSGSQVPPALSGGRYFIPEGRRLCACSQFLGWRASWAGFIPYQ